MRFSLDDCKQISLPKISDPRGNLSFIEGGQHIPFDIKRVYYLYDVPGGSDRGSHAHKSLHQFIVAMSGSFDVVLDDGKQGLIKILLKYKEGESVIKGIERISKPGRRVYSTVKEPPRVLSGLGLAILTTPKGVMTNLESKKQNVGGEVLCYVW